MSNQQQDDARWADARIDRLQARRSFQRAAASYDNAAVLHSEVRQRLLDRFDLVRLDPEVILDAGAGTGGALRPLARRFRRARIVAVDVADAMLRRARRRRPWFRSLTRVCGEVESLPFRERSVDVVFSNLVLPWCNDPEAVFREFARVLRPGGLVSFATFGPDTLTELRQAWAAVDAYSHVNRFPDMHDLGDALVRVGLLEPVMDVEHFTLTYRDLNALMRDLKAVGAQNVTQGRARGLTGRGKLAALAHAYDSFRDGDRIPATYEVVYGHAWAPSVPGMAGVRDGEARIPVSAISRRGT